MAKKFKENEELSFSINEDPQVFNAKFFKSQQGKDNLTTLAFQLLDNPEETLVVYGYTNYVKNKLTCKYFNTVKTKDLADILSRDALFGKVSSLSKLTDQNVVVNGVKFFNIVSFHSACHNLVAIGYECDDSFQKTSARKGIIFRMVSDVIVKDNCVELTCKLIEFPPV